MATDTSHRALPEPELTTTCHACGGEAIIAAGGPGWGVYDCPQCNSTTTIPEGRAETPDSNPQTEKAERLAAFACNCTVGVSYPLGTTGVKFAHYVEKGFGRLPPQRVPVLIVEAGPLAGFYILSPPEFVNGSALDPGGPSAIFGAGACFRIEDCRLA